MDEMMHDDVMDAMRILVHEMGAAAVANHNMEIGVPLLRRRIL